MVNKILLSLTPSQWAEFDGIEQIPKTRSGITFYDMFTFFINGMKEIIMILKDVFVLNFGSVQFNLLYFLIGAMILTLFLSIVFRIPSGNVETTLQARERMLEKGERKRKSNEIHQARLNYYNRKR